MRRRHDPHLGGARDWRALLLVAIAVAASAGCILPPPPATSPGAPSATRTIADVQEDEPRARTDGRLPDLAAPTRYELELAVDPRETTFSGRTTIAVLVREPTRYIVLHAHALAVARVTAEVGREVVQGEALANRAPRANPDELVLRFSRRLPAGPATLRLDFVAPFNPYDEPRGMFRSKTAAGWFAFTQLEPTGARRVFPSFDEPAYKVPFDVVVTVPAGMSAFSNMPEVSRTATEEGLRFRFATSPPLPPYLVAVAVGDLEVESGPLTPVPIRFVRPRGLPGRIRPPFDVAAWLMAALGDYLGAPYPFPKLDLVAVPPPFVGAMENAGFITFSDGWLLPDERRASVWDKTWRLQVLAHEIAHQWAGNLVTLRWWDDTWLNEGLATFLEARALERWRPSFGARTRATTWIEQLMQAEALGTVKEVRETVVTVEDADRVLHGKVEYEKGAAFLFMLERFVGEAATRDGLREYMRQNAWKNATTAEMMSALEKASGRRLEPFARSFLDRPGVPIVDVEPTCAGDRLESVSVRQEAFRFEQEPASRREETWAIPFCLSGPDVRDVRCEVLTSRTTAVSFGSGGAKCPRWLDPNPGLAGYYRYAVSTDMLDRLEPIVGELGVEARLGLLYNGWASVGRGSLGADALLRFLRAFDRETRTEVLGQVAETLASLEELVVDDVDAAFRAYVAERTRGHKSKLGPGAWFERALRGSDDDDSVLRRSHILRMLGMADDPTTLARAEKVALRWLRTPTEPIDPDLGDLTLALGVRRSAAVFEGLASEVKSPSQPGNRFRALAALGNVRDADLLRRALELSLLPDVGPWEVRRLFGSAAARPASRKVLFDWIASEWTRVAARWSGDRAWAVTELVAKACDDEDRERLVRLFETQSVNRSWFKDRIAEAIRCRDLARHGRAAVKSYLSDRLAAKPRG